MGFNFSYLQIIQKTCEKEETRRECQTNCSKNRVIVRLQKKEAEAVRVRPSPASVGSTSSSTDRVTSISGREVRKMDSGIG